MKQLSIEPSLLVMQFWSGPDKKTKEKLNYENKAEMINNLFDYNLQNVTKMKEQIENETKRTYIRGINIIKRSIRRKEKVPILIADIITYLALIYSIVSLVVNIFG